MKPSELVQAITACIAMRRPAFVWGGAGIGKSTIFRQVVAALRAKAIAAAGIIGLAAKAAQDAPLSDGTYFGFCEFRMVYRDAVDMIGLPFAADGITRYNKPAGLPHDPNWKGIILFDEWNSAPQQTQTPGYQIFAERTVGEFALPAGAHIFAAGNRQSDRGVTHRIPDPILNRWFNLYLESDVGDWVKWALGANIRPEVIAFIRFRPALLNDHSVARECHAFATPRSYEALSDLLAQGLAPEIESAMIRGIIGDGAAGEFMAFLSLYRNMVSPDQILLNPTSADVPTNAAILYALAEALARRATTKNIDSVLVYGRRMPAEYTQAMISSATKLQPALCNTREFIAWASANQ